MLQCDGLILEQGTFRLRAEVDVPGPGLVGILGPSGSGKSTLLAAVAGFLAPKSGRILWDGDDITGRAPGQRPLSILFQDQNLFPHLTVRQNLGLGLSANLQLTVTDRQAIDAVLERVGLSAMGDRRPAALSGGQASRAALARALLRKRPLVLLDEPFAALGPALKEEMLALVAETLSDALVLMVTHDPADARGAPHALTILEGEVAGPFATDQLLADPPPELQAYLGSRM
ncbi:MAG: ATP-binding cassette domain-containing protein [Pseudomonadota bacterium]